MTSMTALATLLPLSDDSDNNGNKRVDFFAFKNCFNIYKYIFLTHYSCGFDVIGTMI